MIPAVLLLHELFPRCSFLPEEALWVMVASAVLSAVGGVMVRARHGRAALAAMTVAAAAVLAFVTNTLAPDAFVWPAPLIGCLATGIVIDWRLSRREQIRATQEMAIGVGAFLGANILAVVLFVVFLAIAYNS